MSLSTEITSTARSELNRRSSRICSLPSETFSNIFIWLKIIERPWVYYNWVTEESAKKTIHLGFIKVTFVCKRFRETAIETPRLWSNIEFELGPQWMLTMMERAKEAPILLWAHCRSSTWRLGSEVTAYVPRHIHHLQELTLSASKDEVEYLSSSLTVPAPMLESLSICAHRSEYIDPDPISIPPVLFAGQTPRLISLTLENCIISWDCPNFKSLTSLNLRLTMLNVEDSAMFSPTTTQLLDVIDQNPLLETLILEYCLPHLDAPVFPVPLPTRVSQLPHLIHLTLAGRLLDCVQMLQCLSVSATTTLRLTCQPYDAADPSIRDGKDSCDIIPSLVQHLLGPPPSSSPDATGCATFNEVSLYPSAHSIGLAFRGTLYNTRLIWDLELPVAFPSLWSQTQMLRALFDALPAVVRAHKLDLSSCEFSPGDFETLFRRMKEVEEIHIGNKSLESFAKALDTNASDEEGVVRESQLTFPRLKKLALSGHGPEAISRLFQALNNRKQRGHELDEIVFQWCTVSESQVDEFIPVVRQEVYWDDVEDPSKKAA